MRFITTRLDRTLLAALAGAALAAGVGWLICNTRLVGPLERQSYNLLHVAGGDVRVEEAAIVYMDEVSFKELHQPLNAPWDRTLHARLVERLTAAGAKAIVFDIVFTDPVTNDPAADQRFAAAMKASGRVILAADNVEIGPKQKQIYRPFDLFYDSTAGVGSVEMLQETDMAIRQHTPEEQISSLSWAAAEFLKAPITQDESQRQARRWVRYYGQPGWLPSASYHRALDPAKVEDAFFSNRTVFVGARIVTKMAAFRKDEYATPYSFWLSRTHGNDLQGFFAAGVEVQATMFLNLFRGDWLTRWSRSSEQLLIYALGLLFGFGLVRFRPWLATVSASLGLALVAGTSYHAFREKLVWFPWLIPVVQIVAAWAWSILYNLFQYYAQKRLMEHTLSLYLSPKLVGKFARDPRLLKPGAEKQVLTILFTDIENFTPLAQDMDSNELAEFMNGYFQKIVGSCIHPADGTVVKYIGDAVFSFWNAPEAQPDHALRACDAALRMRELEEVKLRGQVVRTRIGIHTGEANVGNFGSAQRVDYTALGENVNLASRLEGLNKFLGTDCLISAETRAAVGDALVMRRVGLFTLKGFSKSVEVFEIIDRPEVAEKSKAWREAFDQALRNYEDGNFEFATMGFRGVLDLKPDDGPTKFYLERLDDVSKQPVEGDWTGITMLREK